MYIAAGRFRQPRQDAEPCETSVGWNLAEEDREEESAAEVASGS